uniref:V-type proton ATPase subunit a n=1 Tax=Heterorhabditis bacteriophora TaxID=37862 RepID=A0A1I7XMW1_HETBA
MVTTWNRMSMVVDRYERLAICQLKDLRTFQKRVMQFPLEDSRSVRRQIHQLGDQLESGLKQLLAERENLDETSQELFDARVEPIRLVDEYEIFEIIMTYFIICGRYSQETDIKLNEAKVKAEEARLVADATARLNKEHVERANYDLQHGREQLKKALKHKTSQVLPSFSF